MKRIALTLVVALPLAARTAERVEVPPQDKARVTEIAAMLPGEAGFPATRAGSAFWKRVPSERQRRSWIRQGEATLAAPKPTMDGVQFYPTPGKGIETSNWDRTVDAFFDRIYRLAIAELSEDKGRFLPAIEEALDALAALPSWTGFYHDREGKAFRGERKTLELGNGGRSEGLAVVLDKLRDRLSPGCRARALKRLRDMTLDTYLALAADPSVARRHSCRWFRQASNWNAACNRYFTVAALHVLDDPKERATAIEFAERSVPRYLKSFTDDGLCLEGASYWCYGFGNYLTLALWVRAATGSFLGFRPDPFLRKCYDSSFETEYFMGSVPNFGDSNGDVNNHQVQHLGRYVWPDCDYIRFGNGLDSGCGYLLEEVKGLSPTERTVARPYPYPLRSWYPDAIGQLICRPVGGTNRSDRLYAAFQGGHCARPHGHHDVGSYAIAPGGVQVMGDLGNSIYGMDTFGPKRFENPLRNSYGHPVPRVDGQLQSPGKASRATVLRSSFTDEEDSVVYDLATAYRGVSNLVSLVRGVRYRRVANEIDVVDKVVFRGKGAFETALTTTGKVEDLGGGVYRYFSCDGTVSACCRVKVEGGGWRFVREKLPGEVGSQWKIPGKNFPAYRQAVVLDEPVAEAKITVTWFAGEGIGAE